MDFHVEQLVPKKKEALDYIKAAGLCLATVVVWFLIIMFLHNLGMIASVLVVLAGWGTFRLLQSLNIEYEYELTNYCLDIDKILGKARRKRVIEVDFHNIEICTYVTEPEFRNVHGIENTYDLSGNSAAEGRVFVDFIPDGGKKTRVIILPCDKLKEYIKKAAPKTSRL